MSPTNTENTKNNQSKMEASPSNSDDSESTMHTRDLYTRDEDFAKLRDKDETTEITGYIDEVHVPAIVEKKEKYDLFKFILNNGSTKRIMCLVWGKSLIEKYQNDIIIYRILHIEGARTKAVGMTFYKESNNYVPFELLIRNSTIIEFLGYHNKPQINPEQVKKVTFVDIGQVNGVIAIEGYIKMKFVKAQTEYPTLEIYGYGSITDGEYKITVHISKYTDLDIEEGVFVKVIGEMKNSGGPLTLVCRDENSVIPIEGIPKMKPEMLARGVKTPKRGHE